MEVIFIKRRRSPHLCTQLSVEFEQLQLLLIVGNELNKDSSKYVYKKVSVSVK